jgi:deazaflavin-dependent oxidoreductase (nitroreductase family)
MPEKISEPKLPRGFLRLTFRFPIWLYHVHMGWLLGYRFVLLTHTGRKSGLLRQTVLEIVRYNKTNGDVIVASGWGKKSDWFQNVTMSPKIEICVRNKHSFAMAERLSPDAGARELLDYAHRYPLALRELAQFMGYRLDGTEEDICALGKMIPMFLFKPIPESI